MLIDFGQPAAQGADRPLQRGVATDQGVLMGEVPDAGAPVLQIDVAQPRAPAPTSSSIAPQCSPAAAASLLAVSASSVASAPSSSTTSERPRSTPPAPSAEKMCSGDRSPRPAGT